MEPGGNGSRDIEVRFRRLREAHRDYLANGARRFEGLGFTKDEIEQQVDLTLWKAAREDRAIARTRTYLTRSVWNSILSENRTRRRQAGPAVTLSSVADVGLFKAAGADGVRRLEARDELEHALREAADTRSRLLSPGVARAVRDQLRRPRAFPPARGRLGARRRME